MPITDPIRAYAEETGNSMKVMDINPLTAEVVLQVENPANPTLQAARLPCAHAATSFA